MIIVMTSRRYCSAIRMNVEAVMNMFVQGALAGHTDIAHAITDKYKV